MNDTIRFELAVYLLPDSPRKSELSRLDELSKLIKTRHGDLKIVNELPEKPDGMLVRLRFDGNAKKDYAPPSESTLRYSAKGLTPSQTKALPKSSEVLILEFAHPKSQVWVALKRANEAIEDVARQTDGVIWDEATRQVFSPEEWHKARLAPEEWADKIPTVTSQTVVHFYPNGEYPREISLGMEKVGLPNVVVQEVSQSTGATTLSLINLFCQTLAENEYLNTQGNVRLNIQHITNVKLRESQLKSVKSNGLGHACVALKVGRREEGDPPGRLVELSGERYTGPDSHAKQENMISSLYGWDDKAHMVKHTAELLEESQREKAKLPELRKAFNNGLAPGENILLKAPFQTPDGGREWMWVEVTKWENDKVKGLLENTPYKIPTLYAGQTVEISEKDVFDYIRHYADKHQEGNTTERILESMDQAAPSGRDTNVQPEDPDCGGGRAKN
jgi:uncharacterized protein YegJ (DUF2314 family)